MLSHCITRSIVLYFAFLTLFSVYGLTDKSNFEKLFAMNFRIPSVSLMHVIFYLFKTREIYLIWNLYKLTKRCLFFNKTLSKTQACEKAIAISFQSLQESSTSFCWLLHLHYGEQNFPTTKPKVKRKISNLPGPGGLRIVLFANLSVPPSECLGLPSFPFLVTPSPCRYRGPGLHSFVKSCLCLVPKL
jgi:hypothetical protein